jgi:ribonuclease BN (tRNA processing enzyme)
MCLVPGLADGQSLLDEEWLPAALAVDVTPHGCASHDCVSSPLTRRQLLARGGIASAGLAAAGAIAPSLAAVAAGAQPMVSSADGDRIRWLGTSGGPILIAGHSQPALQLIVNDAAYLIDCGGDTARQIIEAGANFGNLRHVFLTHHHFDHTAGIPELMTLGWAFAGSGPGSLNSLKFWGPPPIKSTIAHVQSTFAFGAKLLEIGLDERSWLPLFGAREYTLPKHGIVKVMEDDNVIVHATRVFHGKEVHDAYAYRFDIKTTRKSVVFSGDTAEPNRNLIALAKDADVLVHEVQMNSLIPVFVQGVAPRQRAAVREHFLTSHTDVAEVPRVAKEANAKRLAFCHYGLQKDAAAFLPPSRKAAARVGYRGEILAPVELDEVAI